MLVKINRFKKRHNSKMNTHNESYPIFMKSHRLNLVIVGGGDKALESITLLLRSNSKIKIKVLAAYFNAEIIELAERYNITLVRSEYSLHSIHQAQLVIAATDNHLLNKTICHHARSFRIPVHVADKPQMSDFLMEGNAKTSQLSKQGIDRNGEFNCVKRR